VSQLSFNLLDQPFIPVYTASGRQECSIKEALARAHEFGELRDASPLVTLALHRLLLAILHRNFGPDSGRQWKKLWQAARFDAAALDAYFARWHDRFNLVDAQRPFFQDAAFRSEEPNAINQLVRELARGNNAMLFDHSGEQPPPLLAPSEVARALIAEQVFAVGGGRSELGYTTSGPLIGGVAVLVRGENLFETLMLNLVRPGEVMPGDDDDAPAWERDERPTKGSPTPNGYLDYLTWQSRSIHLHPEEDGRFRSMSFAQGRKLDPQSPIYEPMMAYRREKEGDKAVRLSETKALWRESAALFTTSDAFRRPATLRWLGEMQGEGHLPPDRTFTLSAIGLCTDKAKVNFWRHESFPLPPAYLTDPDLVKSLQAALDLAEEVGSAVRLGARSTAELLLAPGGRSPDSKQLWATVDAIGADALYWSRLEEPFRRFLVRLPGVPAHQKQEIDTWFHEIRKIARDVFAQTAGQFDRTGRALHALVAGDERLGKALGRIAHQKNIQSPVSSGSSS